MHSPPRPARQLVACLVSLAVVERLEADDVDVGDHETAGGPAAAIELVAEVRQARRPCTRPRQDVDLRQSQLARQHFAVRERLLALKGALATVLGSFLTIVGGERPLLRRARALLRRELAVAGDLGDGVRAGERRPGDFPVGGVGLCHREIAHVGSVVSCQRPKIATVCGLITPAGGVEAHARGLLAPKRALFAHARRALADVLAHLVRTRVDAGLEVPIAGSLILVGGKLVALGARLVAVGACLIGIREGLLAVGERLLGIDADMLIVCSAGMTLPLSFDRPVHGIRGVITIKNSGWITVDAPVSWSLFQKDCEAWRRMVRALLASCSSAARAGQSLSARADDDMEVALMGRTRSSIASRPDDAVLPRLAHRPL